MVSIFYQKQCILKIELFAYSCGKMWPNQFINSIRNEKNGIREENAWGKGSGFASLPLFGYLNEEGRKGSAIAVVI